MAIKGGRISVDNLEILYLYLLSSYRAISIFVTFSVRSIYLKEIVVNYDLQKYNF